MSTQNGVGVLKLLQPLDYDKKFLYQLKVLAVDRANTGQVTDAIKMHKVKGYTTKIFPILKINTATNAILVEVEDLADRPPE